MKQTLAGPDPDHPIGPLTNDWADLHRPDHQLALFVENQKFPETKHLQKAHHDRDMMTKDDEVTPIGELATALRKSKKGSRSTIGHVIPKNLPGSEINRGPLRGAATTPQPGDPISIEKGVLGHILELPVKNKFI